MKSVLLVNANIDNLIAVSAKLAKSGYCVIAKSDGASALSTLNEGTDIDLIICNNSLPDMNGLNFFGALKATMPDHPPVILFSDRVEVMTYLTALRHGVFEFLFSPVDSRELLRIVQVAIQQGRADKAAAFRDRFDAGSRLAFQNDSARQCPPLRE